MYKLRAEFSTNAAAPFMATQGAKMIRIDPDFLQKYAHNVANITEEGGFTHAAECECAVREILVPVDAPELDCLYVSMALDVLDGYQASLCCDAHENQDGPREIVEKVLSNHSFDFDPCFYSDEVRQCGLAKASAAYRMLQFSLPVIATIASGVPTSDPDLAKALATFDQWCMSHHPLVNRARELYSPVTAN